MTWPEVNVSQLNRLQGETRDIERVMLFVGSLKGSHHPATPAEIAGGVLTTADKLLSRFTAVTDGSIKLRLTGSASRAVSGIDLSAVTTLADVATALSGKLGNAVDVRWDDVAGQFFITTRATGAGAALGLPEAAGTGTDLAPLLRLDVAGGAVLTPGADAVAVPAVGHTVAVNADTDLDALLGLPSSNLKTQLLTAMRNAGTGWHAWVHALDGDAATPVSYTDAVLAAQAACSVEGVVICDALETRQAIADAIALSERLLREFARWVNIYLAVQWPQAGESWSDYLARLSALQKGLTSPAVMLIPCLFGPEPGALAGRLCNRAVTVADSPARVKTGPVIGLNDAIALPEDGQGNPLDLATLRALNEARLSVPMWYPDYDGFYWADGVTLDVQGGDFQAIENKRVVDKVCRQVRLLALKCIADRALNSGPGSMAAHRSLFASPMRAMARTSTINGVMFPGECLSPREGDVLITWASKTKVSIWVTVRTLDCPKGIEAFVMLDTSLQEGGV